MIKARSAAAAGERRDFTLLYSADALLEARDSSWTRVRDRVRLVLLFHKFFTLSSQFSQGADCVVQRILYMLSPRPRYTVMWLHAARTFHNFTHCCTTLI